MMPRPERVVALPAYVREWHTVTNSKLNGNINTPKLARVDIDNIFGGRSFCLLDHIVEMDDVMTDVPECVVYIGKEGVFREPAGRMLRYKPNCKSVKLDNGSNGNKQGRGESRAFGQFAHNAASQTIGDAFAPPMKYIRY